VDGATAATGLAELESILGHRFRDPRRLEQALTHRSRLPELTPEDPPGDNEKLEFLGDAVLELLVSEDLLRTFPEWSEGQLSKSRARLVNANSLCAAAQRLGLGRFLKLGRGEEKTGGRSKPALLADAYEAVVAAIYLDGGLVSARAFVHRSLLDAALTGVAATGTGKSKKDAEQEAAQMALRQMGAID
jgi:ribonuclease-3